MSDYYCKISVPKPNVSGLIQLYLVMDIQTHNDKKTRLRIGWPYLFHIIKCSCLCWEYIFQAHETWVLIFTETLCYHGLTRQKTEHIFASFVWVWLLNRLCLFTPKQPIMGCIVCGSVSCVFQFSLWLNSEIHQRLFY